MAEAAGSAREVRPARRRGRAGEGTVRDVLTEIGARSTEGRANLRWLVESAPALFDSTLREDVGVIAGLATGLERLRGDRQLVLVDREAEWVLARLDVPGSIFETLRRLRDREITYAEMFHSDGPVPGTGQRLEVQRYTFAPAAPEPAPVGGGEIPRELRRPIHAALRAREPGTDPRKLDPLLQEVWQDAEQFVRRAPAHRVARLLWLLREGQRNAGLFLAIEDPDDAAPGEKGVLFAVENPPQKEFLAQVSEVLNTLDLGVRRS
ncbi:MAG TPA: hypothetical protein VML50_01215, partial [Anaeromyxobacter sp.]|nr:hypothetical protein [Anaeromyxobacter sp.]